MKHCKLLNKILALLLLFPAYSLGTFSIVAYDHDTKEYGVALATCVNYDPKVIASDVSVLTTKGAVNLQANIVAPFNPNIKWNWRQVLKLRHSLAKKAINQRYNANQVLENIRTNVQYSKSKTQAFTDAAINRRQIAIIASDYSLGSFTGKCIDGFSKYIIDESKVIKAVDCSPQNQSQSNKFVYAGSQYLYLPNASYVIAGNILNNQSVLLKIASTLRNYQQLPLYKRLAKAIAAPNLEKIGDYRCSATNSESKTNYGVSSTISYVKVMKKNGQEIAYYYRTNTKRKVKVDAPTGLLIHLINSDSIQPSLYLLS